SREHSSAVNRASSARKAGSPCCSKYPATLSPVRRTSSASTSRKSQSRAAASSRPTVLLPAPGIPTRSTRRQRGSGSGSIPRATSPFLVRRALGDSAAAGRQLGQVAVEVPTQLEHTVPAEFLHG